MNPKILEQIYKDKYYEYLKENSFFIKELMRHPENYNKFKEYIKEKYHLRVTDKVNNVINDIELISSVISTLN